MYTNLEKAFENLSYYASIENSDLGEYWHSLLDFVQHSSNMSPVLKQAVEREIVAQVDYIQKNFDVVKSERLVKIPTEELVFIDE